MSKIVVYFSDIVGTIMGHKNNTEEDYEQFCNLLSQMKENEPSDEIIFSLISSDPYQVVSNVHQVIHPFLMKTVTYGRQFFDAGYYTENEVISKPSSGKVWNIIEYMKELSQNHEIVSVYYVDDVKMYHDLLSIIAEEEHWDFPLHSIIPTKNVGLGEVNELLGESIQKKLDKKNKGLLLIEMF